MALNPRFIARIEKRLPGSFGDTMNDLRSWLDHNKIEPALFKQSDGVEFEISFDNEEAARLFWRELSYPIIVAAPNRGHRTLPLNPHPASVARSRKRDGRRTICDQHALSAAPRPVR